MKYQSFRGACDDVGALMVTVFVFPVAILIIGSPIALCVRWAIDVLRRL